MQFGARLLLVVMIGTIMKTYGHTDTVFVLIQHRGAVKSTTQYDNRIFLHNVLVEYVIHLRKQARFLEMLMLGICVIGKGVDADATTRGEDTRNFNILRIHQFHQILHDDIHAVFVEIAMVAKREEI